MGKSQKEQLTEKGKRVAVEKLLEQGRAHVVLCRKYQVGLGSFGWSDARTAALEEQLFALDALYSGRSRESASSLRTTETEASARQAAKSYIRRLRLAVPLALQEAPVDGLTESSFNAGGSLGRSTPKISKYLMTVRPFVQQLEAPLTVYFGGKSPLAELEAVKAALDSADASQETARAGLPEETANLYLLAGEVLQMIETVNRIAKIAFDGNAEIIGQFNKDLTLRSRRTRKQTPALGEEDQASGV